MHRMTQLLALGALALGWVAPLLAQSGNVTYEYDDAGRLKGGTFSTAEVVQYQYDASGNRTSMTMAVSAPAELSIADTSASEGQNVVFQVTKTGTWASNITVDCVQTNGSAIAGGSAPQNDYTSTPQTITFLASDPSGTQRPCTVATIQDNYYEDDAAAGQSQSINGILQNVSAGGVIGDGSATGTIVDNDSNPSFSVVEDTRNEGTALTFTINKNGLTEHSHDISFGTQDGTAKVVDGDYTATNNFHTFAWNVASLPVAVPTTADSIYESSETLMLNLSNPTNGAVLGTASATGTINNVGSEPSIAILDPAAVTEGGVISFTVTKSGSTQLSHSVNWSTSNDTAIAPGDYTSVGATAITFGPSVTSLQVQVTTIDDSTASEPNEQLTVNLATNGSTNGATISDSQGVGTIADNDGSPGVPASISPPDPPGASDADGSYVILWAPPTAGGTVTHYILARDKNNFGPPDWLAPNYWESGNLTATTYQETRPAGDWFYRVKACNTFGCSGWRERAMVSVGSQ